MDKPTRRAQISVNVAGGSCLVTGQEVTPSLALRGRDPTRATTTRIPSCQKREVTPPHPTTLTHSLHLGEQVNQYYNL